ncbi:MAG: hypothetical protein L3J02_01670, partial [Henriciella sp.]|nr:hypothetical protein [Henriciella sp.]
SGSYFSNSGSDTKGRHHAFHIDAKRLIGSEPFGMRLKQLVSAKSIDGNDGVLVVPDQTGSLFLESFCAAASITKHDINVFSVPSLGIETPEQNLIDFLRNEKNRTLFVLVPISITGYSLQRLQVRLREIVEGPENIQSNIHLFLGVLRPPDQRKIDEISRHFFNQEGSSRTGSIQISVVESLVLPNWQEHQCPWTRELKAISRTLKSESLPSEIDRLFRARLRVVRSSAATGLRTKDVFFVPFADPYLVFNSGSRFLDRAKMFVRRSKNRDSARNAFSGLLLPDASEADLNCAVASSIQRWRERVGRTSLNPVCIDASTISNNNGFNESKLRAALWRSLTPTELRYGSRAGSDFVSMVDRVFQNGSTDTNFTKLELEAILAFGREVPRVCSTTIADWNWRETRYLARHTR